jgi:hypothetical protein
MRGPKERFDWCISQPSLAHPKIPKKDVKVAYMSDYGSNFKKKKFKSSM